MKYWNLLSRASKTLLILSAVFLLYGYLCRVFNINFFWESKSVGWMLFWVMIISLLINRIKNKRPQKKKVLFEKICIGFSVFVLIMKGFLLAVFLQTDAYENAIRFIKTNKEIEAVAGPVRSISLVPQGSIHIQSKGDHQTGQAEFHFIVKGSKKFMDVSMYLTKEPDREWQVLGMR